MTPYRQIRAEYDRLTIVVYQAYNDAIANAALQAQRLVAPFSLNRMTWIKPSFLWLMERSGWGSKTNQERILAIRITRAGWESALSRGVLTAYDSEVHRSIDSWRTEFDSATVHVQWDPERSLHGAKLEHRSIQVGLSRAVIEEYVSTWTVEIKDFTPLVAKMRQHRKEGNFTGAKRLLPTERMYPISEVIAERLGVEA